MKTIITLAVIALFAAPTARAEVITKGGATALFKGTTVRIDAPVAAMKPCAMCKSDFVRSTAPAYKGSAPATAIIERHACASCGSKWVTTGHGKAKADVAVHTCGSCKI